MPADTPTTPLMQDGCWLKDERGSDVALILNDRTLRPYARPYTLGELRALVQFLEAQQAGKEAGRVP